MSISTSTSANPYDTFYIAKIDINDTMTYPTGTSVVSNYLINSGMTIGDMYNGPPIGLIVSESYLYYAAFSIKK